MSELKKYNVRVDELHYRIATVMAKGPEDAAEVARTGNGTVLDEGVLQYSYSPDDIDTEVDVELVEEN